jgi:hypothetical protein
VEAWRQQLARRPGEGSLRSGSRLAQAAWRALRGEPSVRVLALSLAALVAALTVAAFLFAHANGQGLREGDAWAIELAQRAVCMVAATFLFGALTIAVDAAVDAAPLETRDALAEARESTGPLLGWALLSFAVLFVLDVVAIAGAPWYAPTLAYYAWSVGTVFVIPALVLGADSPGGALAESARTLARRWRETLAGLLRIGLAAALALIPVWFAVTLIAVGIGGEDTTLPAAVALVALSVAVLELAAATGQAFALLLYRDAEDDLPAVEPAPRDPMRLRRRIAVATATVFGLLILAFVVAGLASDERGGARSAESREASDPGYYLVTFEPGLEPSVEDGMPILFEGRTVGHVAEHRVEDGWLIVVCWVRRQYRSLARHAEFGAGSVDPRTGAPALGMRPDREGR